MGILKFISTRFGKDKALSKGHVKNLLEVALANGFFDEKEDEFLKEIARERRISLSSLSEIRKNPEKINWTAPEDDKERFRQFYDLVKMMMIKGEIDYKEEKICHSFAARLGYNKKWINDMIHSISENIKLGHDACETMKRVKWMLL